MKSAISLVGLLAASQGVLAFPSLPIDSIPSQPLDARQASQPQFDAKDQLIDVDGIHEWRAPGPLDHRGPCPGLNALANHGYLPRSGIVTVVDAIAATTRVFRMNVDLATVLSAYGGLIDGLGATWGIGGPSLLGGRGMGGSHNNYETDSSPLRADLNQYGSNTAIVMSQFKTLYAMQPDAATANYNIDVLARFRKLRLDESIQKNPYFFYGPFSGTLVSQAAFSFIYRFMGNKTAEAPQGILNKEVLKSFMGITGPEDSLKWNPGHERIPANWYTRHSNDTYGLQKGLPSDVGRIYRADPRASKIGCNTGRTDSYVAVNVSDLTNGAYSEEDLLTNPVCFGVAYANSVVSKLLPIVDTVVQELLLPVQNLLGCRTVPSLNMTVMEACPGYGLWGGPEGEVAEGAVQS